jgi:hypothetical protein
MPSSSGPAGSCLPPMVLEERKGFGNKKLIHMCPIVQRSRKIFLKKQTNKQTNKQTQKFYNVSP